MIWILLLALSLPNLIAGDITWKNDSPSEFNVKIVISKAEVNVNEPFTVALTLTYPKNYHVDHEVLQQNLLAHSSLKVAPFKLLSLKEEEGRMLFTLQPEMAGVHPLSFFQIAFLPNDKEQKEVLVFTKIFEVTIQELSVSNQYPLPAPLLKLSPTIPIEISAANYQTLIAGPDVEKREAQRNIDIFRHRAFPFLEIGLLLLVSIFVLLIKRMPDVTYHRKITPQEAKEKALQGILLLEKQHLPIDRFYASLSTLVRNYLTERHNIQATSATTEELLKELLYFSGFTEETRQQLIKFLEEADQVKFAKHQPSTEETEAIKRIATSIVNLN